MQLNGNLKIAVQKSGRLSEGSITLLKSMGLEFETYENRLFTCCRNIDVDILFLRDDDIPEYVQDGVADLGIVGSNVLEEGGASANRLLPLDFGYCSLAVAIPETAPYAKLKELSGKRIATSYPNILKQFLDDQNIEADVITLKGCVEIAPALKVSDAICDLVSTGSTLRTNRLRVLETVKESQAILIGSEKTPERKKQLIAQLVLRARGVQDAKKYKYVMFNLPKKAVSSITEIVPGFNSPTVIPLADSGYVAIHSVVLEEEFWDVIEKIREHGGSGILVTPIEKLIQ
jgi:ATP phosphoribosyltransferase